MIKRTTSLLFILCLCVYSIQSKAQLSNENVQLAEDFILNFQYADAYELIKNSDEEVLKKLSDVKAKKRTYTDLLEFSNRILNRYQTNFDLLNHFIDSNIQFPKHKKKINHDFIDLSISHISNLRNNNQLDKATSFNKDLEEYILYFDTSNTLIKRTWALTLINSLVLYQIEGDTLNALKKGTEIIKIGNATKDTNLLIAGYFHEYDTYTFLRNLEKAFFAAKEVNRLEELRDIKSSYYYGNLFHLIDLYLHTSQLSKAKPLMVKLYQNPSSRLKSYELISRWLKVQKNNPEARDSLLALVQVNNVFEFRNKAISESEGILFDYDFYYLLSELSFLMEKYGDLKSSNELIRKGTEISRKLYSEDLSKSLAKQKEVLIQKEKELELAAEHKKTAIYGYGSLIIGIFLVLVALAWLRVRKQKSDLEQKNFEIEKQKQEIEKSNQEKALLLKEVHHRVKNNFQIISSLLELQSKGIEDEKAKELAQEGKNRVKSMALIHQRLYQNDDLLIYFDDYIGKLVKEIASMYGSEGQTMVNLNVPKLAFDIDTAIPLGLIINELITNAFKYGINSDEGQVNVTIEEKHKGHFCLEVRDNGNGLPENINLKKAKSLGLKLVKTLSKQLHGSVSYFNESGAVFQVLFKNTQTRAEVD